jgi:predicted MFS family arabinose efflux permease
MSNRWYVLALLFCVRVAMAFQFQTVAALSPLIMSEFKVNIADIGLLIGLYLSPGNPARRSWRCDREAVW